MKYRISDICDINASSLSKEDHFEEILYLDTANLTENTISTLQKIHLKEAPSRAKRKVKDKTILYSSVRPRLCHYGIMEKPEENLIVSTGFITIDVKNLEVIDPHYLFFRLTDKKLTEYIGTIADTNVSSYPSINPSDLWDIVIDFPDIIEQRKISNLLSDIEKKIALNKQINCDLEAMAKQLYDYWFVQFDFPNEEGKPYKSSGGMMVWNETLKREIPDGWMVEKIKDIASVYSGGTPKSTEPSYYKDGTIPWINSGELNNKYITSAANFITELGLNNSSAKFYPKDSILVALYGATAGKTSYLAIEACSNQAVCGIVPIDKRLTNYIGYLVSSLYEYYVSLSTGSARDNISGDIVKNTDVVIPQPNIIDLFYKTISNISRKIILNQKEVDLLVNQRDQLLPLLMNGQVTFKQ